MDELSRPPNVAGNQVKALLDGWDKHVRKEPDMQSLLYSNSAKACDETLIERLEKARDKLPSELIHTVSGSLKEFVALTAACGVVLKSYLMACFSGQSEDLDGDGNDVAELPTIWCTPCTSAANCGVSSKRCNKCYRYGPCPNLHDLLQEMGRVNRLHDALHGSHSYRT